MKVLITHGYFLKENKNDLEVMKPYPLLGLLYISAYLQKYKLAHTVFDSTFSSKADLLNHLVNEKPDVIGFYVNLLTKPDILEIILKIRKNQILKNAIIILGGPDITFNINKYLENGADYLVIGEGEISFYELLVALSENRSPDNVNGIAYRKESNELVVTLPRERIADIDSLELPNRDAIDMSLYLESWKKHHGYTSMNISIQRGCPFSCNWCSSAVFGHKFIQRSVKSVIAEIKLLYQTYHVQSIRFVEDLFTWNEPWVKRFCEQLIFLNLPVTFEITTRAETLNDDNIRVLKKAGCFQVWIGAESGSEDVLQAMNTKIDPGQIISAVKLLKKYGIETGVFVLIGYPGEKKEDIFKTRNFLRAANPDHVAFSIAYPIKGTTFYNEIESGLSGIHEWQRSTDRDLVFRRNYSLRFYRYALSWLKNERFFFNKGGNRVAKSMFFKIKSVLAYQLMNLESIRLFHPEKHIL